MPIIDPNVSSQGTKTAKRGRTAVKLVAEDGEASLILDGGLISVTANARLTETDGSPIEGKTIKFCPGHSKKVHGTAVTDPEGNAEYDSGSNAANPFTWVSALLEGYTAIFDGDPDYQGATSHASLTLKG
ncbi:hypothetical protein D5S18_26270 [Nocardia panacis]|uniref:Uncharacterized protein n=1 Tax=Nocardia panacis TaxID=2340916 RepID=A0A3A4K0E4_9NOCA|nr:hypothetical protein [Nocardia panacis]RJO70713.1 hypothetical protein D5S18_26270 [Nocardia panacis]